MSLTQAKDRVRKSMGGYAGDRTGAKAGLAVHADV